MAHSSSSHSCREIFASLLGPYLSPITLKSTLANLGPVGDLSLSALDQETLGSLRRRLIKIGRCYLTTADRISVLTLFDQRVRAAGLTIPPHSTPNHEDSGPLKLPSSSKPKDSGVFEITARLARQVEEVTEAAKVIYTPQRSFPALSLPGEPPLSFPFRTQVEWVTTRLKIRAVLIECLGNEALASQVEKELDEAAQKALPGGGEVILERNFGLKNRLLFRVLGPDKKTLLSGIKTPPGASESG